MPSRSIARLAARRTFSFDHGDFGSHWSAKASQNVPWMTAGFNVSPGVLRNSSASSPRIE